VKIASLFAAALVVSCAAPAPAPPPHGASAAAARSKPSAASHSRHCVWPNGAQAAVSLTYDDGLASQVKYAVPVLDQRGIKATFFLSGANLSEFAPLVKSGHELGAHTVRHPCNAALRALGPAEMSKELDESRDAVSALGQSGKLSFAYPCGQTQMANHESYVPLVRERFGAARGVAGVVARPESLDLFNVPALFPNESSDGSDVLELVERARQSRGWAVIGVHGVSEAGEYMKWAQPAHDKVVTYLAEHSSEIWTAPFGTVAAFVASCP
jgi:peptidoglycan/xylan/chitin deacetylase (PgdA/CDA1 family)